MRKASSRTSLASFSLASCVLVTGPMRFTNSSRVFSSSTSHCRVDFERQGICLPASLILASLRSCFCVPANLAFHVRFTFRRRRFARMWVGAGSLGEESFPGGIGCGASGCQKTFCCAEPQWRNRGWRETSRPDCLGQRMENGASETAPKLPLLDFSWEEDFGEEEKRMRRFVEPPWNTAGF